MCMIDILLLFLLHVSIIIFSLIDALTNLVLQLALVFNKMFSKGH